MPKRLIPLLLLCFALLLAAGCAPVQSQASQLPGTSWLLSSLDGQLPLAGTIVTLVLGDDNSASGSDGCNQFSTTYTVDGSSLTFAQPFASTMMACTERVQTQATAYVAALQDTTNYEIRSNTLTLYNGRTPVATFVQEVQALVDSTWQATGYNNGREAVVSVMGGTTITAIFGADGTVSGNAGCNDYFGDYMVGAGTVSIGPLGSTQRFCAEPAGIMEQEAAYLAALASAATYTLEGGQLELRTADDALAVTFIRYLNLDIPTPEPAATEEPAVPTARVVATQGVNVRTGPGTNFPVLGFAPYGTEGEVVGRTVDGQWWAVAVPSAPGGVGWVFGDNVAVTGGEQVPVMQGPPPPPPPPPTATPWPTPTPVPAPTATPPPQISFSADRTTINQGECTTLRWNVQNVQAVWVYPAGQDYWNYPQVGQGALEVCPPVTTTYEMLVQMRDGSSVVQSVTITVTPAAPTNPLANTFWTVTGYNNGVGGISSPILGTTMTLAFDDDLLSGSSGCNDFSTGYSVSGNQINVQAIASGMMFCAEPAGVMEQETQFINALQNAGTFLISGNRLELRLWDGTTAVVATR